MGDGSRKSGERISRFGMSGAGLAVCQIICAVHGGRTAHAKRNVNVNITLNVNVNILLRRGIYLRL